MPKIVLSTLNARYSHTSLALRYLYANLHELQSQALIQEYVIKKNNQEIAQKILEQEPLIVGFGVYIWNVEDIAQIVQTIKAVSPKTFIIIGGPEASYYPHRVDLSRADYIISGEGEELFYTLCKDILSQKPPAQRFHKSSAVDLKKIKLPYEYYSDFDIKNRYIYVESSRGCAYECEFCLSSIDKKVRYFDFEKLLEALESLWQRGARDFKFVDRTFNLNIKKANLLIDFFLSKKEDYFLHFEFIPDSFPQRLKERLKEFNKGSLQLEVGIQTLNEEVAKKINRPLNMKKIEQNLEFLTTKTSAHLHLDLIIGLPTESMESFGKNLDTLMALSQCEIQLGVLKKLSGTSMHRHDEAHKMVYSQKPPYDILQTDKIDFLQMQVLKRFARYFDIVYNSGNFKKTTTYLFEDGRVFENFYNFSQWFYENTQSTHQIGLERMAKYLYRYLTGHKGFDKEFVAQTMAEDLQKISGRKLPKFLKGYALLEKESVVQDRAKKRQLKHS